MGRRGPPPKPTAVKKLAGNPGGRPLPQHEVQPPPGAPEMPTRLCDRSRGVWQQVVPRLARLGLATTIDGEALARYCEMVVQWADLVAFVNKFGRTYPVYAEAKEKNKQGRFLGTKEFPEFRAMMRLATELLRIEREFGQTAASRSRINIQAEQNAKGDVDALKRKAFFETGPRALAQGQPPPLVG